VIVVLDTNIYSSALISGGKSLGLIQKLAADPCIQVYYSDAILQETLRVLREKFNWPEEDLREAEQLVTETGQRATPTRTVDVVKLRMIHQITELSSVPARRTQTALRGVGSDSAVFVLCRFRHS